MASFDNWMLKVDETLSNVLGQWDIYTTSIAAVLLLLFSYQVFSRRDPDVHPMLLARQAQASPVRQAGESPVYRSHSSPHGMDLNGGLNVRDPGMSKWGRGRDGDLRDVWRRIVKGPNDPEGKPTNEKGRIMTVLGIEQVIEHDLDELTQQINIIGQYLQKQGGSRVAIFLPNSIEFLVTLFACAFYDMTPILLPYDQSPEVIISMLKISKADSLVAAVGSIPFDSMTKEHPTLLHLIWVVDEGSKHLDWNEVPKGTGGNVNVSTWQEIIEDNKSASKEVLALDLTSKPKPVAVFWRRNSQVQMNEFTHSSLVSALSAQLSAIPSTQRISQSDLFFPADSLSNIYTLVVTLAAAYYNASLALNSVAGPETDLTSATEGISPTIIVASVPTIVKMRNDTSAKTGSIINEFKHWYHTRALTEEGVMPSASSMLQMDNSILPSLGTTPGKLRLIFVADQAGTESPPITPMALSDLRIFTGARIIYALTAAKVAGAISQTTLFDYRIAGSDSTKHSHFGAPVSSVEVLLRSKEANADEEVTVGEIIVRGPAVISGETNIGVLGTFNEDNTLAYAR